MREAEEENSRLRNEILILRDVNVRQSGGSVRSRSGDSKEVEKLRQDFQKLQEKIGRLQSQPTPSLTFT